MAKKTKKSYRGAKDKFLSSLLYTYVQKKNRQWVLAQARKKGVAYSILVDRILTHARNHA